MKANTLDDKTSSGNQGLIEHLLAVGQVARSMAHPDLKDLSEFAGIWHDVGKATPDFQDYLKQKSDPLPKQKKKKKPLGQEEYNGPLHHQISWALLTILSITLGEEVPWAVYFHHVTPPIHQRNYGTAESIISFLKKNNQLQPCIDLIKELKNKNNNPLWQTIGNPDDLDNKYKDNKIPCFGKNPHTPNDAANAAKFLAVRSFLVEADRFVSSQTESECIELSKGFVIPPHHLPNFGQVLTTAPTNQRDQKQVEIVNEITDNPNKLYEINELTGFGKTRVALMTFVKSSKNQMIFLVPRSSLAQDRYYGILKEIEALNLTNISIEAIYGGGRQLKTDPDTPVGASNIVVATVDSYLLAQVRHGRSHRFSNTMDSLVVFDEYQEVVCESALFAASAVFLTARSIYAQAPTILMSATPLPIFPFFLKKEYLPISIPVDYTQPSTKIELSLIPENSTSITAPEYGGIVYTNAVSTAQNLHISNPDTFLAHARYTRPDRQKMMDDLLKTYSGSFGPGVVSTSILQSGVDISFLKMTLVEPTPIGLVQSLGRYCRGGGQVGNGAFIFLSSERAEEAAANIKKEIRRGFLKSLFSDTEKPETISTNRADLHKKYKDFFFSGLSSIGKYLNDLWTESCSSYSKVSLSKGADIGEVVAESTGGGQNKLRGDSDYFTMIDSNKEYLKADEVVSFFVSKDEMTTSKGATLIFKRDKELMKKLGFKYCKTLEKSSPEAPLLLEERVYHRGPNGTRGLGVIKREDLPPKVE